MREDSKGCQSKSPRGSCASWGLSYFDPDKAKPSVRRARNAAGLTKSKMAELPKDEPAVSSAFLFLLLLNPDNYLREGMKRDILQMPLSNLSGGDLFPGRQWILFSS